MSGLTPRLRGGIWYAVGSVAGVRVRKSLGTRHRGQAEELCAHLETTYWKRHSYGEEAVRTFEEAALAYQEAGGEKRFLAPLIKRFRGRVLGTIKPGEITKAARELLPERKAATWNRQVVVPTRAVINHGAALGWCPVIAVEAFPTEKPLRKAIGRTWIDLFVERADRDRLPHLAAGVLFMFQTGTRISESLRVFPRHLDLTAQTVLLEDTKEGAWEVCHISREMMLRFANLAMHPTLPVFRYAGRSAFYKRMKAVCRRAGIPFVSPHQAGRHSFASNALAMGANVREVMEAGRWKSARMVLEIYAHSDEAGKTVAGLFDTQSTQHVPATKAK